MLRLGVVSDIHWCPDVNRVDYWHEALDFAGVSLRLGTALAYFDDCAVDAVVLLGDLSHDGDSDSLDAVRRLCAEHWSGPLFVVAGNHDLVDELPDAGDVGRIPLVKKLSGGDLSPSGPLVLLTHYPLLSQKAVFEERGFKYAGCDDHADEVVARLLERSAPTVVLCGHVHARESRSNESILQLTVGALIEPPFECAIVELETSPEHFTLHRHSHRLASTGVGVEPVFAPADENWAFQESGWVCAWHADAGLIA
jgi:predicted phosphodiesterase